MKLYLSSYQAGNQPEKLQQLVGSNKRAAVIANAVDFKSAEDRRLRVAAELDAMQNLGFDPVEVDLRDYFGNQHELEAALSVFGLLWVRGGNVFVLRKAMALSGFDKIVRNLLNKDIVYGGYSAASCVAGPTLRGLELCDPLDAIPEGYPTEPVWEGLNLIDYTIIPHYQSDHPESPMIDDVVAYYDQHTLPYQTLRDGEAIVVTT